MSLPTAHSYVIETLMGHLSSVEKNFLKPSMLLEHLTKTEKVLSEAVEVLSKQDFLEEIVSPTNGNEDKRQKASKELIEFYFKIQANNIGNTL